MKNLLILPLVGLLAACGGPTDAEKANVANKLPAGCHIIDFGSYGSADDLFAVVCDGRQTTTSTWKEQHGKVWEHLASVVIGSVEF